MGNVPQYLVHQTLKILSSVLQPKGATREKEKPERGYHRGLFDIRWIDRDLVITLQQIHFAEDGFPSQVGVEVLQVPHGVSVVCCP